jgi:uncharacterized RDD family membrane protein YckC
MALRDPRKEVVTSMKNATLLRRLGAIVYDSLLMLALLIVATIPFIAIRGGQPVEAGDDLLYQLCLAAIIFVFFTGFWSYSGRTLGMQSWGLRVETPNGEIPTFTTACIRFFAAILSWLPAGLGFVWQLWDKDQLTWHDRLSGTQLRYYPKPARNK